MFCLETEYKNKTYRFDMPKDANLILPNVANHKSLCERALSRGFNMPGNYRLRTTILITDYGKNVAGLVVVDMAARYGKVFLAKIESKTHYGAANACIPGSGAMWHRGKTCNHQNNIKAMQKIIKHAFNRDYEHYA